MNAKPRPRDNALIGLTKRLVSLLTVLAMAATSLIGGLSLTLVTATPAQAAVLGDDYPAYLKNAAKDALVDPWNFYNRECTSFVAWRLNNTNGVAFHNYYAGPHWGNATNWGAAARTAGITVNSTPAIGAVAWWSSGHVAWVADINGTNITIEEYNYNYTGLYHTRTITTTNPTGYIHIKDLANSIGDGSFISHNGYVYRIAGGAPLYVSSWDVYGGGQTTTALSDEQFNALRSFPADGTFVNGVPSGRVFRFAGGAPQYVSTWSSYGGSQATIAIDDFALDHPDGGVPLDHLRRYPVDGTFVSNTSDGRVYRIAGGAPLYVSSWDHVGGAQPTTALDPWEFTNYQHLRAVPSDMFIRGLPSGRVFRVVSTGHPYYVESWDPYGGAQPYLDVDDWAIDNCDHLGCSPFGNLDSVTGGVGQVKVGGWAIDPNARNTSTIIHVYVGGPAGSSSAEGHNLGAATTTRTDVAAAFPGTGNAHGFASTIVTNKRGTQNVYLYALNVNGTPGENVLLGTRTVSISAPAVFSSAPVPVVSGTVRVGQTLTANPGTWAPAPVTLTYQWLRNGTAVPAATKATYPLTTADLGTAITVRVTGTKTGYTTVTKTSAATTKVAAAVALTGPTPTVTGTARVGKTLTATPGTWAPAPVTLTYQWLRNGTAIPAATKATYPLTTADLGTAITVRVTGTKTGYTTVTKTSAATTKIATGTLTAPTPRITGKTKVGRTLTAKPGTWQPAGTVLTYRWYRGTKLIKNATTATYKLTRADKGKRLKVKVTGRLDGYTTRTKTSTRTNTIHN